MKHWLRSSRTGTSGAWVATLNERPDCASVAVRPEPRARLDRLIRITEFVTGLVAAGISIVVLANPFLPIDSLIVLLAVTLAFDGLRLIVSGGIHRGWWRVISDDLGSGWRWVRRLGRIGIGVIAVLLTIAVIVSPQLRQVTLLYLVATGVLLLSVDRLGHYFGRETPAWLRGASLGTGLLAILLVGLALVIPSLGLATFAILVALALLFGGIQDVVAALRPTDPRQIVLLRLVLFALFYGLVLINWIDLFGKTVPAYGIWLILTYFAPFAVILVYQGYTEWPLALSLGLLVSLANDVGYYFVGNLLFGFHQNLVTWTSGQLGLEGTRTVTIFEAGAFSIHVDSWMMGLSIYVRALIVTAGLYYWWKHPARIVASTALPPPASA